MIDYLKRKALKSLCKHKVAAIGVDDSGRIVNCKFNKPRFSRKGGSIHAELECIKDLRVRSVIICRVNKSGKILPLHPCKTCEQVLQKLRIKIILTWR